jgi:LacI family transcriptional regulator
MDSKRKRRRRNTPTGQARMTIHDVAREAGVSTATVSRVLNNPEKVKEATREAVLSVVRRRHYVFDGHAVSLASTRSRTLGLIIPTIMNSIYAASTQAIQSAAQDSGYTVLVGISDFSAAQEALLVQRLLERRVDGLILTGTARDPELYEKIRRIGVPFVITWRLSRAADLPSISFDNYTAARTAVDYLVSLDHRRIGLICGRTEVNDRAIDRRQAYEDALADAGLEVDPQLICERDFDFLEGRAALRRLMQLRRPPSAIFCANDIQAVGALSECQDMGIAVPDQLSIVGFDDMAMAQYTNPKLTTIRVPASDMGRRAAQSLVAYLEAQTPLATIELPTDLVVRQTTSLCPSPAQRRGGQKLRPRR